MFLITIFNDIYDLVTKLTEIYKFIFKYPAQKENCVELG